MITQTFLLEFESSLLRSFAKASRKVTPRSQREPNFLGNAQFKEEFMKEFLTALQERKPTLENEVLKGGHRNYEDLTRSIFTLVEDTLRSNLTTHLLNQQGLDQAAFEKVVRGLKNDVRTIFYG